MKSYIGTGCCWAFVAITMTACGNTDDNPKTPINGQSTTCPIPAACGGALDGTWQVDSVCVQGDLVAFMNSLLPAACNTLYQSISYSGGTGTISYANGTETPNATTNSSAQLLFSSACALARYGVTLDATACTTTIQQDVVSNEGFTSATCSYSSQGCLCAASDQSVSNSPVSYTLSGTSIVYSSGDPPAGYCVSGTTLTEVETLSARVSVTFVSTLHRIQ
jgi:hypothetical protein